MPAIRALLVSGNRLFLLGQRLCDDLRELRGVLLSRLNKLISRRRENKRFMMRHWRIHNTALLIVALVLVVILRALMRAEER